MSRPKSGSVSPTGPPCSDHERGHPLRGHDERGDEGHEQRPERGVWNERRRPGVCRPGIHEQRRYAGSPARQANVAVDEYEGDDSRDDEQQRARDERCEKTDSK